MDESIHQVVENSKYTDIVHQQDQEKIESDCLPNSDQSEQQTVVSSNCDSKGTVDALKNQQIKLTTTNQPQEELLSKDMLNVVVVDDQSSASSTAIINESIGHNKLVVGSSDENNSLSFSDSQNQIQSIEQQESNKRIANQEEDQEILQKSSDNRKNQEESEDNLQEMTNHNECIVSNNSTNQSTNNNNELTATVVNFTNGQQSHQQQSHLLFNNNNSQQSQPTITTTTIQASNGAMIDGIVSTNTTNHLQHQQTINENNNTLQQQQQQQPINNNSTLSFEIGGKRVLLSANSQPSVNTSINMNQQHLFKQVSSLMTNGTMTPPQSPSVVATMQQQQTMPVGQQVALAASSTLGSSSTSIRPSTPQQQQSGAINNNNNIQSANFVMTSSNNKSIAATAVHAQKSLPGPQQSALLTTIHQQQSNGQHQTQPTTQQVFMQQHHARPTLVPNSLASLQPQQLGNLITTAQGTNIQVQLDPRQHQILSGGSVVGSASSAVPSPSNIQFILPSSQNSVVSRSFTSGTLTPTAVNVSGGATGFTMSSIATNSALAQGQIAAAAAKSASLGSRIVQLPGNLRLAGSPMLRGPANQSFSGPVTLSNTIRGQAILLKGENGQVHMVNVTPAGPQQQPQIRLQMPPGVSPAGVGPSQQQLAAAVTNASSLRTITGNHQIQMVPVSLAGAPSIVQPPSQQSINNASALMNANKTTPTMIVSTASQQTSQTSAQQSPHQPLSVNTSNTQSSAASAAPSQMSPTTAKKKCKNFLSTLIRLASDQPENVASNVKTLIQGLIDDTIQPEDFTNQLQKELNSSPQPCLVPFLKKSLPYLRYSLMKEELTIDGVRPPSSNALSIPPSATLTASGAHIQPSIAHLQNIGSIQAQRSPSLGAVSAHQTVRLIAPSGQQLQPGLISGPAGSGGQQILTSLPAHHQSHLHHHQNSLLQQQSQIILSSNLAGHGGTLMTPSGQTISLNQAMTSNNASSLPHLSATNRLQSSSITLTPTSSLTNSTTLPFSSSAVPINSSPITKTASKKSSSSSKSKAAKERAEKKKIAANPVMVGTLIDSGSSLSTSESKTKSSSFRDDDDINDVAAMGGVNLQEEHQRIMAGNAEIIGQQIRSCKDEPYFETSPLRVRINKIVKRFELDECQYEVVSFVSHAVQERLKTLVERLGGIAEHRQEQLRNNPNYQVVQDVKAQSQFLQEIDRLEKRRHEEQEREVLIRAAKSRSKVDDPDQLAIKARAKEMQRLEMEEIRQREANETALQAIGNPKKRLKISNSSSGTGGNGASLGSSLNNGFGNSYTSGGSGSGQNLFGSFTTKSIKRIKRVTMKDVIYMMERDRTTVRSSTLYRIYAR